MFYIIVGDDDLLIVLNDSAHGIRIIEDLSRRNQVG
jgi:hypothetical protein